MISEPEFSDGSQDSGDARHDGAPDAVGGSEAVGCPDHAPAPGPRPDLDPAPAPASARTRVRLPRISLPPWRWALGAAVVASVVWAGSLFGTGYWQHTAPDLHGYRLDASPCAGAVLKPLTDAIVALDSASAPAVGGPGATSARFLKGSSVDQGTCSLTVSSPAERGGTVRYAADVSVDLHKKTDPRAEFEDQRRIPDASLVPVDTIVSVPGLGDEAYLLTPGEQTQQLKVLHGGAVFVLTFTAYSDFNVSTDTMNALHSAALPAPELQQFQPALIATVRNVMAALEH